MERADKYINDIELLFQEWKIKHHLMILTTVKMCSFEMVLYARSSGFPKKCGPYICSKKHITEQVTGI